MHNRDPRREPNLQNIVTRTDLGRRLRAVLRDQQPTGNVNYATAEARIAWCMRVRP